jgi:hypothetical protein
MHLSPEDHSRQLGKTFTAQASKIKSSKYVERRVQDYEQNEEI